MAVSARSWRLASEDLKFKQTSATCFLKSRGFATELALMLLEPLVHSILGTG